MISLLIIGILLAMFWDELCGMFGIIMLIVMIVSLKTFFTDGARKKMKFILDAQREGRYVPGKLTCLTKEGKVGESYYCAEYMYVVNGKRYFTTYKIMPQNVSNNSKNDIDGNILALDIQKFPTLFYGKYEPTLVYCKADVFTSSDVFQQIETSKQNLYRDVEKNWVQAIDLTTY